MVKNPVLEELSTVASEAVALTLILSLPVLGIALVVGLFAGLIQTLTQLQEQSISFVPKLIAVFVSLLFLGPWIGAEVASLTSGVWAAIADIQR